VSARRLGARRSTLCIAAFVALAVSSCRCGPRPVDPVELGLRVMPASVDFGRVLEGDTRDATVTFTATTRVPVSVAVSAGAPFSVSPASIEVPGGGEASVVVRFKAGNGSAEGPLTLTVGDLMAQVPLRGVGVRPPPCIPSGECIVSTYSLEEDKCLETQAPDDSACDPASVCLEQGRCRQGQCLGVARKCDDDDACTDDACAMDVGCIHTPHQCPAPTALCQVATCDSRAGCGSGPAPDLSPCGAIDCVEANFCFQGSCRRQPTPEGYPCSPAVACLPEATCHNQVCDRVKDADWNPDWSAALQGVAEGALVAAGPTVFLETCSTPVPGRDDGGACAPITCAMYGASCGVLGDGCGGVLFCGTCSGGATCGGGGVPFTCGGADAGSDAGVDDGGADGGVVDGGASDGGEDAGPPPMPPACGLTSYTGTGFWRFTRPWGDRFDRDVLAVNAGGVIVSLDGGLEVRTTVTGAVASSTPFSGRREQVVVTRNTVFLASDAGLAAWQDGGLTVLAAVDPDAELAGGQALYAWNADAGVLTRFELLADGGLVIDARAVPGTWPATLSVVNDSAVFGAEVRAWWADDGGLDLVSLVDADAGPGVARQGSTLSSTFASDRFVDRCDGGECVLWVDAMQNPGGLLWQAPLASSARGGQLIHAALVDGMLGESLLAVVRYDEDGGSRTEVSLVSQGGALAVCRLPVSSGRVERAIFTTSAMVVGITRADGGSSLESYGLGVVPVSRRGWPTVNGVGSTRADRQ